MDCNIPEETYLQIGDKENHCSKQDFIKVSQLYLKKLSKWNNEHGKPFEMLDIAYHFDEAVPQLHFRKVWKYKNDDGIECIGQEEALKRAGLQLPKPNQKKSRYNNRKMVFDEEMRRIYLDCCKECGLEIIEEPLQGVRHNMTKDETINQKLYDKQKSLEAREAELNNREATLEAREAALEAKDEEIYNRDKKSLEIASSVSEMINETVKIHQQTMSMCKSYQESYNSTFTEKRIDEQQKKLDEAYRKIESYRESEGLGYV